MDTNKLFPHDFLWGASTASHQVEGNTHNQWTVWELENASRLAKTAEKRLSWLPKWDDVSALAQDPANYISGNGVEHYARYKQDFRYLTQLNLNSFRFSIEWSRLEPAEGQWSAAALQHYVEYVRELKKQGIQPMLNIWHWTNPIWFEELGAFEKRKNIKYFSRFVRKLEPLLQEVDIVVTINEPNNVAWFQYVSGDWPPARTGKFLQAFKVFRNLIAAHKASYHIIKQINPSIRVTTALSGSSNVPLDSGKRLHRWSAKVMNYYGNTWYLARVNKHQDIIGLNYYFKNYVKGPRPEADFANPKKPLNDLGWYMEPYGVLDLLQLVHKKFPGKPIIILENGVADRDDEYREWWIKETMLAISDARRQGINLVGYMHWSLLDNFEWAFGWWPQFGLIHVDRKTMKRTVRPSAKFYAAQVKKLRSW